MSKMRRPDYVIWIFTGKCNLNCKHCYAYRFRTVKELTLEEKLRLIKEIGELGVDYVGLSGGEPLIHPHFPLMLKALREYEIYVSMVTNGTVFKDEVAGILSDMNMFVNISVDGPREIHDAIRGTGVFDKVMENVEKYRKHGIRYGFVMTITKLNYKYVDQVIALAVEKGAERLSILPAMPTGKALINNIAVGRDEYLEALKIVDEKAEEYKYPVSLWCTPFAPLVIKSKYVSYSSCRLSEGIDIDPEGNILLCDILDVKITSIRDKTLLEAWKIYLNHPILRYINEPPNPPNMCRKCPIFNYCRTGCYARSYLLYKDYNKGDPLCPRTRYNL